MMLDRAAVPRLLDELAEFGRRQDAHETERSQRLLNVTPDTGQFLSILVRALHARRVLEIGTSNGYSTIWLTWAAHDIGGHVTTSERSADKIAMARVNLQRAGLADRVTIQQGPARDVLAGLSGTFDLIFLDADRPNYLAYLDLLLPLLTPGGVLITDNVISHADEVQDFLHKLKHDPALETVTLPLGNGEEVTYKLP
jgi:predicted O-methyltransferase YrrM